MKVPSGMFMGYALFERVSWNGDDDELIVGERRVRSAFEKNDHKSISCAKRKRQLHIFICLRSCKVGRKGSDVTPFNRIWQKYRRSAVIFKEQSNNENKMNWKQSVISGVCMEASFIDVPQERPLFYPTQIH